MNYINGLVSIIIPTYKRSSLLKRAINSAKNQTYKAIEILVVDDNEPGSADSEYVKSIIEELGYSNLRLVLQKKHINGAAARNAGIKNAKGQYISFLDDDDMILPTKIEKEVRLINSLDSSYGGVSTRKIFIKNGQIISISEKWKCSGKQNYKILAKEQHIQTCTLLLKHTCLDESGLFDENLRRHQEVQLMTFFTNKYKVAFLDEPLTIIDSSDIINRPNSTQFLEYKNMFFDSVSPIMCQYNTRQRSIIVQNNMIEIYYVMYQEGNRIYAIKKVLSAFRYPETVLCFAKRYFDKIYGKISKELIGGRKKEYIYNCIHECESGVIR